MKKGSTMKIRKAVRKLSCFIICVLLIMMSACSNGVEVNRGAIELKDYIDTPITGSTAVIEDVYDVGATDGTEYTNGAVRINATFDSDNISSITISAKCNYSLYGVTFGMDIDEADTIAYNECVSQTQDSEYSKTYVMENDCYLYIQSQDGKMVTEVQLTNYDANPNNGKGGLDYDDTYYDSDENEYFNPDEFYNDYYNGLSVIDYSNYGFYDSDYGDTWIKVKEYDFSDSGNAFVLCMSDYTTMTFNYGTLKQERWNRSGDNRGVHYNINNGAVGGYFWSANTYQIVDNYSLVFTGGYTGSVTLNAYKEMKCDVPFIDCKFNSQSGMNAISNGTYIPANVIDWTRSPEVDMGDGKYDMGYAKYYIKSEYIY